MKHWSLNPRWRIHAIGGVCCVVIGAIVYFASIGPTVRQWSADQVARQQAVVQQSRVGALQATEAVLARRLAQIQRVVDEAPVTLRSANYLNRRVAELTELTLAHELVVHEIDFGQTAVGKHYQTLPLRLMGTGSYRQFTRFLRALYENCNDISVTGFDLSTRQPSDDTEARFTLTLGWHAAGTDVK